RMSWPSAHQFATTHSASGYSDPYTERRNVPSDSSTCVTHLPATQISYRAQVAASSGVLTPGAGTHSMYTAKASLTSASPVTHGRGPDIPCTALGDVTGSPRQRIEVDLPIWR